MFNSISVNTYSEPENYLAGK